MASLYREIVLSRKDCKKDRKAGWLVAIIAVKPGDRYKIWADASIPGGNVAIRYHSVSRQKISISAQVRQGCLFVTVKERAANVNCHTT